MHSCPQLFFPSCHVVIVPRFSLLADLCRLSCLLSCPGYPSLSLHGWSKNWRLTINERNFFFYRLHRKSNLLAFFAKKLAMIFVIF
jgi:hypothetical protein